MADGNRKVLSLLIQSYFSPKKGGKLGFLTSFKGIFITRKRNTAFLTNTVSEIGVLGEKKGEISHINTDKYEAHCLGIISHH